MGNKLIYCHLHNLHKTLWSLTSAIPHWTRLLVLCICLLNERAQNLSKQLRKRTWFLWFLSVGLSPRKRHKKKFDCNKDNLENIWDSFSDKLSKSCEFNSHLTKVADRLTDRYGIPRGPLLSSMLAEVWQLRLPSLTLRRFPIRKINKKIKTFVIWMFFLLSL